MEIRELVKHFKAGSWTDPNYVGQLMNHVGDVSPRHLERARCADVPGPDDGDLLPSAHVSPLVWRLRLNGAAR